MPCDHWHQGISDNHKARYHCRHAWQRTDLAADLADSTRGDPPYLEGNDGTADPKAVPTDDLGVCYQTHRQVHPGAGCLLYPWCFHEFGEPRAMTRQWRCKIMAPQGATTFIPSSEGQQQGGTNSTWESHDNATGRFPGLAGLGFKAAHRAGVCTVRTLVQPPREVPAPMAEGQQVWNHGEARLREGRGGRNVPP
jgi:hypothetical protein